MKAHVPSDPDRGGVRPPGPARAKPSQDGVAGRPGGTCVSSLTDAARLVDFVVWEMRAGDLPEDVKRAATRLSNRPRPGGAPIHYAEGPLSVDGFPHDDDAPLDRRRAYPHQAGAVIRDLLARGCRYVLVQDIGA